MELNVVLQAGLGVGLATAEWTLELICLSGCVPGDFKVEMLSLCISPLSRNNMHRETDDVELSSLKNLDALLAVDQEVFDHLTH